MSKIIVPEAEEKQEDRQVEVNYDPTEYDEEEFILMYHLHLQPSEIMEWSEDKRRWVLGRFVMQKQAEREMMEQMRLRSQIGGNIKIPS